MRPDQHELTGTAPPTSAAPQSQAHLNPENEKQLPQVVTLVSRTGKGKIVVAETVGQRKVFAVVPWRLRNRADRRFQIATALIRALPWTGRGPDPGVPQGWDEKDENQGGLDL